MSISIRAFKWIFLAAIIGLAAFRCTPAQIQTATTEISAGITAACGDATQTLAVAQTQAKGGALNTVNNLAPYVIGACATAQAVAALAQNSGTLQWLGQLTGMLSATATVPPVSTSG